MGTVIKRDGKRQKFSPGKIKKAIEKTAKEAGLSSARRKELLKEVALPIIKLYKNKRAKSTKIRSAILRRLSTRAKSVVAAWRRYEKRKKRKK
ncbi:hypothetical protein HYT25_03285 [Candidatus Pacearchaeota archaeon]|nr:hypothetical protein [Candidatus Pacearchaeota archaeon]